MEPKHEETAKIVKRMGLWVKRLREETSQRKKKRSQEEVAKSVRYSRVTLSNVERAGEDSRTVNPRFDLVVGLAKAFGIRVSDLIALAEAEDPSELGDTLPRVARALDVPEERITSLMWEMTQKERLQPLGPVLREAPPISQSVKTELPSEVRREVLRLIQGVASETAVLARFAKEVSEKMSKLAWVWKCEPHEESADGGK